MWYRIYVICSVVPSHAKLHMYITASNQYNYVTCWTQFLSLTVLVSSCPFPFPFAINRPCTALHIVWRYDIHLIDWILRPLVYIYCLLKGRYFTRGCHVAFSVMNTCTESLCFHVTIESALQRIRRHQNYIQPYKKLCPGRYSCLQVPRPHLLVLVTVVQKYPAPQFAHRIHRRNFVKE